MRGYLHRSVWLGTLAGLGALSVLVLLEPAEARVELELTGGRGSERLAWSVGVPAGGPNVLSELTFQRTTTTEGGVKLRWRPERQPLAIQLDGRIGVLEEGTVRDDDFAENDRQGLFSRSVSRIDGNALLDLGIRADLALVQGRETAGNPSGVWLGSGWRFSQQTWRIVQGRQLVPKQEALDPRLNSTYRARWLGPELALLVRAPLGQAMTLQGELVGWPVLWYQGQGTWNLRPEFRQDPSFRHTASGFGVGSAVEWRYWWDLRRNRWSDARAFLGLGWQWQWMATKHGTDTTFVRDDSPITITFNGAERHGQRWVVAVGWTF
jgi:hypothetical protein